MSTNITEQFEIDENIIRAIYSPINIHKTKGTLLPNAFRTPASKDEVSVNRLNYTTLNFCKNIALKNEIKGTRNYFGFAVLKKWEIDITNCDIVYSPILKPAEELNLFHADIKVGFIPKKGEELPSEISKKIRDLATFARFYIDPNPNNTAWSGIALDKG